MVEVNKLALSRMNDINPFGAYDKTDEQPDTSKTIPFTPGGVFKRPTWEPESGQETSFRG